MRSVGGRRHTGVWWAADSYRYCSTGPSCEADLSGDEQSGDEQSSVELNGVELSGEDLKGGELMSYGYNRD
jgi:hypothetical protein